MGIESLPPVNVRVALPDATLPAGMPAETLVSSGSANEPPPGHSALIAEVPRDSRQLNTKDVPVLGTSVQTGGSAETLRELQTQVQTRDRRALELLSPLARDNSTEFLDPNYVPPGRTDYFRNNDSNSIRGLGDSSQKLDRQTLVVSVHGHPDEILLWLLQHRPDLQVQGVVHNVFGKGDFFRDGIINPDGGQGDALYSADQRQTYGNEIKRLQDSNGGGGALYVGIDTHGNSPPLSALPSAEQIRKTLGPDAKLVVVSEEKSGTFFDPVQSYANTSLGPWFAALRSAGISVEGVGIDGRSEDKGRFTTDPMDRPGSAPRH